MRWRVGAKMKMANEDIIEQQFRSDTLFEYEWPEKVIRFILDGCTRNDFRLNSEEFQNLKFQA